MPALTTPLDEVLGTKAKVRICRLLTEIEVPLSAREIGRRTGTAKRSADLAIADLVRLGVVDRQGYGAFAPYSINTDHPLVVECLRVLFLGERQATTQFRIGLKRLVQSAFAGGARRLLWAGIYGSTARGEDTPESDLDLAIIVEDPEAVRETSDHLTEHTKGFEERFGRRISVLTLSAAQFRRLYATPDSVAHALVRDGRRLAGETDLERLGGGEQG